MAIFEVTSRSVACEVPLMALGHRVTDKSGRTLSGQTIEAFWTSDQTRQAC